MIERLGRPTFVGRQQVAISSSIGIAFAEGNGSTSEQILRNADLALYAAKKQGRNCWCVFDRELEASCEAA